MKMIKIFRTINYLMALLFIFAAVVQYNDPDSLLWVAVYGLAAAACILWIKKKMNKIVAITLAVISLIWSALVVPDFTGQEAFNTFSMQSIEIEEMRESLGLVIIAAWMFLLAFVPQKKDTKGVEANA